MIYVKEDLLSALKSVGVSTYVIRRDKIIGECELNKIRHGGVPSWATLDKICRLTRRQPGDYIGYRDNESTEV